MDFRVAASDGQDWIDNPYNPHQSISADTHIKLCRWGEGKHAVCNSRGEDCLPPRSSRYRASRASTTTCRRRRLSSSSTSASSVCVLCEENAAIATARRVPSSRTHHHHPIPSARGEARGMCQWIAGDSSSTTGTSYDRCLLSR